MKLLIAGLPGSGKTTQARILAAAWEIPLISTGTILREMAKDDSPKAKRIHEELLSGQLVDDDLVAELIKDRLSQADAQNGFIIDGYPRSLEQLKLFDPFYDQVVYLRVSEEVVEERLLGRGREDDKVEIIEERFEVYHHETEPLIEYFKEKGLLESVDGSGTIEEVTSRIKGVLKSG